MMTDGTGVIINPGCQSLGGKVGRLHPGGGAGNAISGFSCPYHSPQSLSFPKIRHSAVSCSSSLGFPTPWNWWGLQGKGTCHLVWGLGLGAQEAAC